MPRIGFTLAIGLLAMMALAPGVLGCRVWNVGSDDKNTNGQSQFSALSAPGAPPAAAVAAAVLIPIGVVGAVLALAFGTRARPTTGRWVASGAQWVWVPDRR